MDVKSINVQTGKVTERDYTQKELDAISQPTQGQIDAKVLRRKRQLAAYAEEEKMLMAGTTAEAKAYQSAKP